MSGDPGALAAAARRAYSLGLGLCMGLASLAAALVLAGRREVDGSALPPELVLQVGYLFSGLFFLGAAWVTFRRRRALLLLRGLPEARRLGTVRLELGLYGAISGAGSLLGLAYWWVAGPEAARHVWAFVLMPPGLFLALAPRAKAWVKALGE